MKINLKQLQLHQEDTVYFDYQGGIDNHFLADSGARIKSPLVIALMVKRQNQVFYASGIMQTVMEYSCSRCLKSFARPVSLELSFIIADPGHTDCYDEEVLLLEDNQVDITAYIEGTIFAAIPLNPICDPSCKGLCPFCGGDRNIDQCDCAHEEIDPRWEKLKKLNREGG